MSKIKVLVGLVPSGGSEEELIPCLSPNFWYLPAILEHFLFCRFIIPLSTSVFSWHPPLYVFVSKLLSSYKDTSQILCDFIFT